MGAYQTFRGNPEQKLLYTVDQLIGGVNTDFSDDASADNEFQSIVNFTMDKRGSLYKRKGFGKQDAVSEIMNMFENLPDVKTKSADLTNPEITNDNIVYAKLIRNDNNVFRELSRYVGTKRLYRKYQMAHGKENNRFTLLIITTNYVTQTSKSWLYDCTLPDLIYDDNSVPMPNETIILNEKIQELPIKFKWDNNLLNIENIDFFNDIYATTNDFGLVKYDINAEEYKYYGPEKNGITNSAYKPNPMEIRKVGFNVLGNDPLRWVDYQSLSTDSIQGVYLTYKLNNKDIPTLTIPSGGKFNLNVLYTGKNADFGITFKEGETNITASVSEITSANQTGLKVYEVTMQNVPTSEVELKVTKTGANVDPYYDYYSVGKIDIDAKPLEPLNLGDYGICEMYNRAVYYKEDTIWFSAINNFSYVPNYNYVVLPIDKTDKITKIIFFRNVYIIFTRNCIYKMIGSFGSSEFSIMPVNLSMGCHAPNTIVPIENELYFASTRGLYSLKSSEFRDGIENLKELDTKVKRLTSEVITDLGDINYRSYVFSGISEKAYAIRYKDQYMLIYNTENNAEDYEDISKIDALIYNYSLKSFTETKFTVKPTFIFMVDNRITTYCKYSVKEEYTKETKLLSYNFDKLDASSKIVNDETGHGYNGVLFGNAYGNYSYALNCANDVSKIVNKGISDKYDIAKGFKVKFKMAISSTENGTLFSLKQSRPSGNGGKPQNFKIETDYTHGYKAIMYFYTAPDIYKNQTVVNWDLFYQRYDSSVLGVNAGIFTLEDLNTSRLLIDLTQFDFNMGNENSKKVSNGSFIINHDNDGNYSGNWKLKIKSNYETTTKYWVNGDPIPFNVRQVATWNNGNYGIKIEGLASVKDGVGTIRYTPYVSLGTYGSLNVGPRNLKVWLDGEERNHSIPAINSQGSQDISGGQQTKTLNYIGNKIVSADAQYNIRATISGTYRENLDIDGFNITMPFTEQKTETIFEQFSMESTEYVKLNKLDLESYRPIIVKTIGNNKINIYIEDEKGSVDYNMYMPSDLFNELHLWEIHFENVSDGLIIKSYIDGGLISEGKIYKKLVNGNRDIGTIFDGHEGTFYYFEALDTYGNSIFKYDFEKDSGVIVTDLSSNKNDGKISGNMTWLSNKGLTLKGGYVKLPSIPASVRFTNGFSIKTRFALEDNDKTGDILILSTTKNAKDKCYIKVSYDNYENKLVFTTSTLQLASIAVDINYSDLYNEHDWIFDLRNENGLYLFEVSMDGVIIESQAFNLMGVENILRTFNTIGYSEYGFNARGIFHNFEINVYASQSPVKIYEGAIFEYDTSFKDFDRDMIVYLETKGINMKYPLHVKKLKNIFIKGLGGFNYNKFFFEVYVDGHLVNDPRKYRYYVDEISRHVIFDYTEEMNLEFNERTSMLDYMRLDKTRLGDDTYETKKMIVPAKGKNFAIKIYGRSADYLKIESFGYVCKLGKVRED